MPTHDESHVAIEYDNGGNEEQVIKNAEKADGENGESKQSRTKMSSSTHSFMNTMILASTVCTWIAHMCTTARSPGYFGARVLLVGMHIITLAFVMMTRHFSEPSDQSLYARAALNEAMMMVNVYMSV